ncbi:MAG TPA: aldo/keto reductase [Solirubrobacteraceae bacterium]|nr:aldo/keto reductase [Solirubrobacteraceae bacterium]
MRTPSHTAIGTWSGGRYLHFGEPIDVARLEALLTPGRGLDTLLTADAYGAGEADRLLGRALAGTDRDAVCVIGAIGHDFYEGEREGARGYPRFTDPRLRAGTGSDYADYVRMATERSLERLGIDAFDLLLLHNPDRTGYTSETVWEAMRAVRDEGLAGRLGIAPGPANGFTLDIIDCLERFGELIDWAMVILNPLEPWPAELCLRAAREHDVKVLTRVIDYGGLFWDDVKPGHAFTAGDHRTFRPEGWVDAGVQKLEQLRPIAERHGLTLLQLAAQWCLAHEPVACVVPTLIQEPGPDARTVEAKREELLATPREIVLDEPEVATIREIGDNTGSMSLKGADPQHEGEPRPDRWTLTPDLDAVARRWGIEPDRDLRHLSTARG